MFEVTMDYVEMMIFHDIRAICQGEISNLFSSTAHSPRTIQTVGMCIFARAVFECGHGLWGRRLRLCSAAAEHDAKGLPCTCIVRVGHGLQSRKLSRKCDDCQKLQIKLAFIRMRLAECQITLCRSWPAYLDLAGDSL
jgi:hypothetical protein